MRFLVLFLSSLFGINASYAQIDLQASSNANAANTERVRDHQFLSAFNTFTNNSAFVVQSPFYSSWYLSSQPSSGCGSTFLFDTQSVNNYLVGTQYVDGLNIGTQSTAFIIGSDLSLSTAPSGAALADGMYCLTYAVNIISAAYNLWGVSESNYANNLFTFSDPICYGLSCTGSTGAQKMLIYPNPAQAQIHIELPDSLKAGVGGLMIYDLSGRRVFEEKLTLTADRLLVNVATLAPGAYIVTIFNETSRASTRLEKQ